MVSYWYGIVAGFAATVVVSLLLLIKQVSDLAPEVEPIGSLNVLMGGRATYARGWSMHVFIGTVAWGLLFAFLAPHLPGAYWVKGVILASGAWIVLMAAVMPLAGKGFFAAGIGRGTVLGMLVLHEIFGAVLGVVYAGLVAAGPGVAISRAAGVALV